MARNAPVPNSPINCGAEDEFLNQRARWLANEFRQSYSWLKSRLQRRVRSQADVEDIASCSFLKLAETSDPTTSREPRALLMVIAQRLTFEMWRRRDLERAYLETLAHQEDTVAPSAEDMAEVAQALLLVDQALTGLSPKAKSAFVLSQVDGLTHAEIAEQLGVSVSMVRKYIAKALTECYLIV
jgi:RNA polymerase sigma-19 factor, ECF subfamily